MINANSLPWPARKSFMSVGAETLLRKFRHASKYDGGCQEEYLCHDGRGSWYIDLFGLYTRFRVILVLGDDV